ncbi:MAG: DNA methyltransferase [Coprobacillus cateniformis]
MDKEYCLYFRKGISLHTTYQTGKTYWITPTNVKDKKLYGHPTIKPIDIIKTLIQNSSAPGDVVFDCFSWTAVTTARLHQKNWNNYIGIEKNSDYCETTLQEVIVLLKLALLMKL